MFKHLPSLFEKGFDNQTDGERFYFVSHILFSLFLFLSIVSGEDNCWGGFCLIFFFIAGISSFVPNVGTAGLLEYNQNADLNTYDAGASLMVDDTAGSGMNVDDRVIARMLKKLEAVLIAKGYTAESLITQFDRDGDGEIDRNELEAGLVRVTGAQAPPAIINAVFAAIDQDGSGAISISEFAALLGTEVQAAPVGGDIRVSNHSSSEFNGIYVKQSNLINGKPWFLNENGSRLYFYNANSGGAPSWSLDNRAQDGSNDWYNGGWARPPANGEPPIGSARFIGVGKIDLAWIDASPSSDEGNSALDEEVEAVEESVSLPSTEVAEKVDSVDTNVDPLSLADSLLSDFESAISAPNASIDVIRAEADARFENQVGALPSALQGPARTIWKLKADAAVTLARSQIPDDSDAAKVAAGIGLASAVAGGVATGMALREKSAEPVESANVAQEVTEVSEMGGATEMEVISEASEGEKVHSISDESALGEAAPISSAETSGTIQEAITAFVEARYLNDQRTLVEEYADSQFELSIRVSSVERTFGIGLRDEYRGGSTLVSNLPEGEEVEIRLLGSADASIYHAGTETNLTCSIGDWNGIRKRLILYAL